MDFSNLLYYTCFICAGLTCLRTILSQSLRARRQRQGRGRAPSLLSITPTLNQLRNAKQSSGNAPMSELSGSGRQPSLPAPMACNETCASPVTSSGIAEGRWRACTLSGASSSRPGDDHKLTPLKTGCESPACSYAGSSSSCRSSSQADSDAESEGRRPLCGADCSDDDDDDDERRSSPSKPQLPDAASPKTLRPAIRLPRDSAFPKPLKSTGGQRKKSVTFHSGGAVICSPPTAEALDLLAAGTPPLPPPPPPQARSFTGACPAGPPPLALSCLAESSSRPRQAVAAGPSPISTSQPAARGPAGGMAADLTSPPRAAPASRPPAPIAAGSSHPTSGTQSLSSRSAAEGPSAAFAMTPMMMTDDAAHTSALARAAEGRRRVMAALEEAKSRHAHLGRGSPPDGNWWPSADGRQRLTARGHSTDQARQRQLDHQQQQQLESMEEERQQMGRLPNLPLARRDLDILSVGYASSCAVPPPEEALQQTAGATTVTPTLPSASAAGTNRDHRRLSAAAAAATTMSATAAAAGGATPVSLRLGVLDGGVSGLFGPAGAALGRLAAADRMKLVEAVATQSLQMLSWEGVAR